MHRIILPIMSENYVSHLIIIKLQRDEVYWASSNEFATVLSDDIAAPLGIVQLFDPKCLQIIPTTLLFYNSLC